MNVKTLWISSLEKVFADEDRPFKEQNNGCALLGEKYHFQLAVRTDEPLLESRMRVEINSPIKEYVKCFAVKSVPVMLAAGPLSDDDFLRKTAGLYPDMLEPCLNSTSISPNQWRSLYFEADIPKDLNSGEYPVTVSFFKVDDNTLLTENTFEIKVIDAVLPEQKLLYTCWFHNDCLSLYYDVPVFSEKYWEIVNNYMNNAAKYGMNMILTPIFTPALNTAVGHERPTVQLVDIKHSAEGWEFNFDNLERYIETALSNGITHFEFAHLCTQWGAWNTPKIMVWENGSLIRKFGWDTASVSEEYISFLYAFLPKLKSKMSEMGLLDNCYFHISDEPNLKQIDNYSEFCKKIGPLLEGCHVIDALFDYEYYRRGIIKTPIPSNDNVEDFIEKGLQERWTYYCCGQLDKVSNRMVAMPSYRTRILGFQLFKYKIDGFLQWGYNFWFNSLSKDFLNPYLCTDCEDCYPSGDAFIVYPAKDGTAFPSIREMVFLDALQDLRALEYLEELIGFDETVKLLEEDLTEPITFKNWPRNISYITDTREKINKLIAIKHKQS